MVCFYSQVLCCYYILNAVFPFVRLITEILFIVGIIILLFLFQPLATTISVLVILIISLVFLIATKEKIKIWAIERQKYDSLRIKIAKKGG